MTNHRLATEPRSPSHLAARSAAAASSLAVLLLSSSAWAHVAFDGLPDGTVFVAGTKAELRWVDVIPHDTTAYHLNFIPSTGADAVLIADVPAPAHSYSWQVTASPCSDCSLEIVQDNSGVDYAATAEIVIVDAAAGTGAMGGISGGGSGGTTAVGGIGGGSGVGAGGTAMLGMGGTAASAGGMSSAGTAGMSGAGGRSQAGAGGDAVAAPKSGEPSDDQGGCSITTRRAPWGLSVWSAWLAGGALLWRARRRRRAAHYRAQRA